MHEGYALCDSGADGSEMILLHRCCFSGGSTGTDDAACLAGHHDVMGQFSQFLSRLDVEGNRLMLI